ncbi:MAG: hypothetical protein AAGF01_23210 [Cyanobacteria bacterium P01_G01_bin.38]
MQWLRIRPLLANWPGNPEPPTFEIMADENGDAIIELAFDPQALLAPASYDEPLRYYSTDIDFEATLTNADGSSRRINVPAQTIRLTGNRASWTLPQALWDGYLQETLKSLDGVSRTSFQRNIYYRVRITPVGGTQAHQWPSDIVIQNDATGAPHMGILAMSGSPGDQVIPDQAAVEAMGGIPGVLPNLWGHLLSWLWQNLPEADPNRQSLANIFSHEVFETEIRETALRGKILKLWLFAGTHSRPRLSQLLDRRVEIGTNITEPIVAQRDLQGTKTLIDNLLALLDVTPHPDLVNVTFPEQLVDDVLTEILDPNGQVNQGAAGTCSPTSIQTLMLTVNPAEYVRLQIGLLSDTSRVNLANGNQVSLPPGIFQVVRYNGTQTNPFFVRTNAELAFQAAILKYAQGARFPVYNPAAPANSPNGVNTVFQRTIAGGLRSDETDRALEGVFNVNYTTHYVPLTSQAANQAAQPGIRTGLLRDLPAMQQPFPIAMYWNAAYQNGHVVLAIRHENGRLFFKNPQYAGSNPPAAAGSAAANPPRRYEDPSATLESISEADLLTWIKGYWVPDHAI